MKRLYLKPALTVDFTGAALCLYVCSILCLQNILVKDYWFNTEEIHSQLVISFLFFELMKAPVSDPCTWYLMRWQSWSVHNAAWRLPLKCDSVQSHLVKLEELEVITANIPESYSFIWRCCYGMCWKQINFALISSILVCKLHIIFLWILFIF